MTKSPTGDDELNAYAELELKQWRAWGSWFSWGSPVGLSIFLLTIAGIVWAFTHLD